MNSLGMKFRIDARIDRSCVVHGHLIEFAHLKNVQAVEEIENMLVT